MIAENVLFSMLNDEGFIKWKHCTQNIKYQVKKYKIQVKFFFLETSSKIFDII